VVANPIAALIATEISSGADHSCAIVEDGAAYCWGSNAWGQLGFGSRDWNPHPLPLPVLGGLRFKSIAAGGAHSCGLTIAGETYCWGGNLAGQIGTAPSWDVISRPTRIAGAPAFTAISIGAYHTCGLTSAGAAFCWGDNSLGQLGDGSDRSEAVEFTFAGQPTPRLVSGSHVFKSIQAHYTYTCGLTIGGDAYCWGGNDMLNLGSSMTQTCRIVYRGENGDLEIYGDNPCSTVPVRVVTSTAASSVTVAQHGACAVLTNGGLECWGFIYARPTSIPGAQVTSAWLFNSTVCGMSASGSISCQFVVAPFKADNPFGAGPALVNIHSSGRHHCGLSSAPLGTAYCWDTNYDGALGDGTTQHRKYPVPVAAPFAQRIP